MLYSNKFIVISAVIGFLLMCQVYTLWQDKRASEQKINELSAKLLQLENNAIKQNQIIAENENAKRELENTSLEQQEKINELLKDNDCANQLGLLQFLTACTTERKIYVNQPILANLLSDCLPNLPPQPMTFGDSVKYNEHLLNVIEMCNQAKKAIREINK